MDAGPDDQAESQFEGIEFEWHKLKAAANLKKHRVSFEEAMTIFGDKRVLVVPDQVHSDEENRSLAIGQSVRGRLLTICFTEREDRLRIISARLAERWERREYEAGNG
jgi:uncharacterized DUF497 family protein